MIFFVDITHFVCYIKKYVRKYEVLFMYFFRNRKGISMSRLTDRNVLEALQQGKSIMLNNDIILRELLDGSQAMLYALHEEEIYWKPYSPTVWELSQDNWIIKSEN